MSDRPWLVAILITLRRVEHTESHVVYESTAPHRPVRFLLDRSDGEVVVLEDQSEPDAATDFVLSRVRRRLGQLWADDEYPDSTDYRH